MAELIFWSMLPASVRGGTAAAVTPVEPRGSPPVEQDGEWPGSSAPLTPWKQDHRSTLIVYSSDRFVWPERRFCGKGWTLPLRLARGCPPPPPQHFNLKKKTLSFSGCCWFCTLVIVVLRAGIHSDCPLVRSASLPWYSFQEMMYFFHIMVM